MNGHGIGSHVQPEYWVTSGARGFRQRRSNVWALVLGSGQPAKTGLRRDPLCPLSAAGADSGDQSPQNSLGSARVPSFFTACSSEGSSPSALIMVGAT